MRRYRVTRAETCAEGPSQICTQSTGLGTGKARLGPRGLEGKPGGEPLLGLHKDQGLTPQSALSGWPLSPQALQSSRTRLPWGSISEAPGEKAVLSSPFRQDRLPGLQSLAVLLTAIKPE